MMMFWFLYYGVSMLFIIYIFLDLTWRFRKRKLSFLPTFPNVPWLGSMPYFIMKDSSRLFEQRVHYFKKYNHLFAQWWMSGGCIKIGRVEYVEALLKNPEFIFKPPSYNTFREWLGDGLLVSGGAKWKKRRHALTSAFHFSILNNFVEIFDKHALQIIEKIKTLSETGKEIEVQWLFTLAMLDVLCETSMGVTIDAINSSNSEYARAVEDVKRLMIRRLIIPFGMTGLFKYTSEGKRFFQCIDILHTFTRNVIENNLELRRKNKEAISYETTPNKRRVFIDIVLDLYEKNEIDIEGIQEEVDTFMFAGHDTTSLSISWILYEIGRHPDIQQKVQEEIDEVKSKDLPLVDKIRLLKYTECVIKESLRLHCPVPAFSRKLPKDMVIENNIIPEGTEMILDTFSLHWNPEYWPEPLKFDPSRFDGSIKRNPYCFVPFSAGPRNCIGQKFAMLEEKVFIYHILSNFNLESIQKFEELKIACDIITHSENGINIKFFSRSL